MIYSRHEVDQEVELGGALEGVVQLHDEGVLESLQQVSFGEGIKFGLAVFEGLLLDDLHGVLLGLVTIYLQLSLSLTSSTCPKAPLPSTLIISKSSIVLMCVCPFVCFISRLD